MVARLLFVLASLGVVAVTILGVGPLRSSKTLTLAHNHDTKHPVHQGMEVFAAQVRDKSEGRIQIKIYPNAQLGNEREVLEQLQIGAVSMTKVSSLSLESFSPVFGAINAPYLFRDEEHHFRVLDGAVGERLLLSLESQRLRGLTYYNGGARSFYANKPILHPDDLKGLKMRVMGSQTAIKMAQLLGGSPVPMPYGEIYTGLQQSVIDGAENNITALTLSRHGEVAKHYSLDQHIMAPDVLLVSTQVWEGLDEDSRRIVKEAAEASKFAQRKLWEAAVKEHMRVATEQLGVTIHQPDQAAFAERVRPLHLELKARGPEFAEVLGAIEELTRL